ncbi:16S rRNA (uracil(1498)-N(3))-methyltransferase [Phenylobacterium sp.]|uniref:16S rRNA (uracil(1498)-N(3))-methyltransferase n=1 Tax=Phenylobacterium sp. TaxID=1871053 RepID=UPI002731EDE5|nr:16S rRNA (uracil(1498)-N(3))-methyltransferase [Phenylobacterium sp.]MDP1874226.1 16S rRNA (uracil(1498)-N(3))-methyltransferase [Phenylobacterium sp.]
MIRLFVTHDLAPGAKLGLNPDQSRYVIAVMRRSPGDPVLVFNGRDGEWRAVVIESGKRGAVLEVEAQTRALTRGPDLDLIVAVVKRARLETIIEKACELGARRVRLVLTERTNPEHIRLSRLNAIATEAAEQTGRIDLPEIFEPIRLSAVLDDWEASRRLLFCDEAGDAPPVLDALRGQPSGPWAVLIGPEGGFSPAERERLRSLDQAVPASLGPRILRADTAAISALTLWQSACGDWRDHAASD